MMKAVLILGLVVLVGLAVAAPQRRNRVRVKLTEEQQKAADYLDGLDINELIKDKEAIRKHAQCFLEEDDHPCEDDEVSKSIKVLMDLAIEDECRSCTSKQRGKLIKLTKTIKYEMRDLYLQLLQKFNDGVEPPELEAL